MWCVVVSLLENLQLFWRGAVAAPNMPKWCKNYQNMHKSAKLCIQMQKYAHKCKCKCNFALRLTIPEISVENYQNMHKSAKLCIKMHKNMHTNAKMQIGEEVTLVKM